MSAKHLLPPLIKGVKLYKQQQRAVEATWELLFSTPYTADPNTLNPALGESAAYLEAQTGSGKTFVLGQLLRDMEIREVAEKAGCLAPYPYLYVTKATIVEKTKRDLRNWFGLDTRRRVFVTNYDQLRATIGKFFLEEIERVVDGERVIEYKWRVGLNPFVVLFDEAHALKNKSSTQSKIGRNFSHIRYAQRRLGFGTPPKAVCASATPGTCVDEFRYFCVLAGVKADFVSDGYVQEKNFQHFADSVASNFGASDTKPFEHAEAAMDRLKPYIDPYIVSIEHLRPQFKVHNRVEVIPFACEEDRKRYDAAWLKYLENCAKIGKEVTNSRFLLLVEFLKFRMAAELIRAPEIARRMYHDVTTRGKAAIAALSFKSAIAKVADTLYSDFNVSRDQISLIWGGDETYNSTDKAFHYTPEEIVLLLTRAAQGIAPLDPNVMKAIHKQLSAEEAGLGNLPPELRLGPQSMKQRQEEIDRFQTGKSLYCIFSFKSGGCGLSLHHTDDMTEQKVRHQENGYAVLEDIPLIPTRPRSVILAPTYSAIESVQGLGRGPRLTSLSDTEQVILFYKDTIEEHVAALLGNKLKCLGKLVKQKDSWANTMYEGAGKGKGVAHIIADFEDMQNRDIKLVDGSKPSDDGSDLLLGESPQDSGDDDEDSEDNI